MPNWITPQGKLYICKDVPLDPTYQHTLFWGGAGQQVGYFQGKAKYAESDFTYLRKERPSIKVEHPADKLYDCNYIMFQNAGFGTKWFYAFITGIEYINNQTTEIYWELDVMQTWYFDYHLGSCFIDREHAATDEIGDNIVPESLALGEYVMGGFYRPSKAIDGNPLGIPLLLNQVYVVAATVDASGSQNVLAGYYAGYPVGCAYHIFEPDGLGRPPAAMYQFLAQIVDAGKADGIISVFMCPKEFATTNGGQSVTQSFAFSKKQSNSVYGFEVKNKKLFTYPFNFLYIQNMQGKSGVYMYEFFSGGTCTFDMKATMSPNGEAVIYPTNYKGIANNYDERMSMQINPEISYSIDSYRNWTATKGLSTMLGAIAGAFSAGVGFLGSGAGAGAAAGAAGNLVFNIANTLANDVEHYIQPPQTSGSINADSLKALNMMDFMCYNKHITTDMAKRIDEFFTMFGYATKRVKVPNRRARSSFCFTKTVGCVITGSIPAEDAAAICRIYDNGVTFWRNHEKVGDYSLSNTPTGSEGE